MSVRERLLTVQIHEAVNIYNSQAQLDKADVEMHRRLGGFNFQRRRLSTFFYRDDDIVSTSTKYTTPPNRLAMATFDHGMAMATLDNGWPWWGHGDFGDF